MLPCLLKHCNGIWCFEANRALLPCEALTSQGLPICGGSMKHVLHWNCQSAAAQIRIEKLYGFAGNGISLPVAGAVIIWSLTCFSRVEALPAAVPEQ